jgi:Tannase and feruloyl esterase
MVRRFIGEVRTHSLIWITAVALAIAMPFPRTGPVSARAADDPAAARCEALMSLTLPESSVKQAGVVAAGAFAPDGRGRNEAFARLPAFCRVAMTLTPSADSNINVEVWLPLSGWNGKYQAVGNGGWAGTIGYPALAAGVTRGYSVSATDTGHSGNSASFALGHPEKLIDYAYRSEHVMTVVGKAVVQKFYGNGPRYSYFNGCSTGGRQALVEASRFPNDFDGIIAGAAANPKTHLDAWRMVMSQAMLKNAETLIPPAKYPAIHEAVLEACDALDGVRDRLIEDPTRCRFDPQLLLCKGPDGPKCLTAPQVEAARVTMSPLKDPRTGAEIFPGFEPGNELGWGRLLGGPDPYETAVDTYRYVVLKNPAWNWRTFSLERDLAEANRATQGTLSAVDPNLTPFAVRGGKLLMYHGWADQDISPRASINFYSRTRQATQAPQSNADWVRLFMVPGMQHCGGGEGPNTFDTVAALESWVEHGQAPTSMLASHGTAGRVDRTRPLCPYPQVAKYKGAGSIDEAANFTCAAP